MSFITSKLHVVVRKFSKKLSIASGNNTYLVQLKIKKNNYIGKHGIIYLINRIHFYQLYLLNEILRNFGRTIFTGFYRTVFMK